MLSDSLLHLEELIGLIKERTCGDNPDYAGAITHAGLVDQGVRQVLEYLVLSDVRQGASWTAVAASLGVTRQAAHQRFGHLVPIG